MHQSKMVLDVGHHLCCDVGTALTGFYLMRVNTREC